MNLRRSQELFEEAQRYLPGGVDSPVRAFKTVDGTPPFIVRGQGSRIFDADGNEFIDYVCSCDLPPKNGSSFSVRVE